MTIVSLLASVSIVILPLGSNIAWSSYSCGSMLGKTEINGYYQNSVIYTCWQASDHTKYHELGHHFWTLLTEDQRAKYTKAYNTDMKQGLRVFHRQYAMTNVEEDFADNFSLIAQGKSGKNRTMQKRIQLIFLFLWK